MRMRFVLVSIAIVCLASLVHVGCTANKRAKSHGGTMTLNLPPGEKLVSATWKDNNLWYLTRPMRKGESPETSTLHESSNLGIIEGSVIFKECCK